VYAQSASQLNFHITTGKYIVGVPVMAGLADVLLGYVSSLLWALITGRTFLIMDLPNLDGNVLQTCRVFAVSVFFLQENAISEQLTSHIIIGSRIGAPHSSISKRHACLTRCMSASYHPITRVVQIRTTSRSACQVSKGVLFSSSIQFIHLMYCEIGPNHSVTAKTYRAVNLFQVNGGFKGDFKVKNMSEFPPEKYKAEVLLFLSNRYSMLVVVFALHNFGVYRGVTYHIFDNPFHNDTVRLLGLTPETAFPCIFDFLFRMKPEACTDGCQVVEKEMHVLGKAGIGKSA
jgi:hypothetical protein